VSTLYLLTFAKVNEGVVNGVGRITGRRKSRHEMVNKEFDTAAALDDDDDAPTDRSTNSSEFQDELSSGLK
jgi:hypothetical protein